MQIVESMGVVATLLCRSFRCLITLQTISALPPSPESSSASYSITKITPNKSAVVSISPRAIPTHPNNSLPKISHSNHSSPGRKANQVFLSYAQNLAERQSPQRSLLRYSAECCTSDDMKGCTVSAEQQVTNKATTICSDE